MLKELIIRFSDWNAARLKNAAERYLARSRWWINFADWLETGHWGGDDEND